MSQPEFWGKKDAISMGRALRLAVVANQYDIGNLSEQQAKDLLSGPIIKEDDSTVFDDSAWLKWKPPVRLEGFAWRSLD